MASLVKRGPGSCAPEADTAGVSVRARLASLTHLAQFMGESGYRLHYPGAVLCRRADDPRAPPLAGASEVERVLSR